MNKRDKVLCVMIGMMVCAGMMLGAMFCDLYGYDAVGWMTIPTLVIFASLFYYWTRGKHIFPKG